MSSLGVCSYGEQGLSRGRQMSTWGGGSSFRELESEQGGEGMLGPKLGEEASMQETQCPGIMSESSDGKSGGPRRGGGEKGVGKCIAKGEAVEG